jgi:hypothetical protein
MGEDACGTILGDPTIRFAGGILVGDFVDGFPTQDIGQSRSRQSLYPKPRIKQNRLVCAYNMGTLGPISFAADRFGRQTEERTRLRSIPPLLRHLHPRFGMGM